MSRTVSIIVGGFLTAIAGIGVIAMLVCFGLAIWISDHGLSENFGLTGMALFFVNVIAGACGLCILDEMPSKPVQPTERGY